MCNILTTLYVGVASGGGVNKCVWLVGGVIRCSVLFCMSFKRVQLFKRGSKKWTDSVNLH